MFQAWGRALYRARRLTLGIGIIVVLAFAAWGTGVFGHVSSGNDYAPGNSQSSQESARATAVFGRSGADVVVLYRSATMTVADPGYRQAVTSSLGRLPAGRVTRVTTYWSGGQPAMVSADRHATYAVLQLAGADDAARQDTFKAVESDLPAAPGPGVTAQVGGVVPTEVALNTQVTSSISRAELISLPVLLILLLVIFGSLVAALLPLIIGVIGILGAFTVLRLLTLVTSVSAYSVNIATLLGLGLGIDYGLFMVTRFREELRRQPTAEQAVARTVATAGRTVVVSGVTVAVALCSLMIFPVGFLQSMGYGGVATVLVDVIAAVTIAPALLGLLGRRIDAIRVRRSVSREPKTDSGAWYRLAQTVMRRPVVFAGVILVLLLTLGAPFLRISWGGVDARSLPASSSVRQVTEAIAADFPANSTTPIQALVTGVTGPGDLAPYLASVKGVPGVTGAQVSGVAGSTARIDIGFSPAYESPQARQLVGQLRALPPPAHATVLIGGATASLVDELSALGGTLPWMALLTFVATFVLLFLAFGSVVLPVKAIAANILSLSATFGVIVWVFQWGHLSGLLGFTPTGTIDPTMPILLLACAFGLSMDYEVFLVSRMRELYDETGDNAGAVAGALQRTGGLITSLALLLIIVVGLFSASGITFIKLFGVGAIVALAVDASIVRCMLVPAVMRMLGSVNWWAPRPLRRLYAAYGIRESDSGPRQLSSTP